MTTIALRLLLVDDEALARLRLRSLVESIDAPLAEVVAEAENASEAEQCLARDAIDLVLLDIAMPGEDGLALAARWRARANADGTAPAVVFVTAHAEHALRAFELDAADYLTKPVRRERLQEALQRVAQRRGNQVTAVSNAPSLVVNDRGRMLRLPLAELLYLKAELKYVTLRTAEHRYVLDDALGDLEQRLGDGFMRVHRNAIVARHAVRKLERRQGRGTDGAATEVWAVQLAPTGEWLNVSRRLLGAVREALGEDAG